MKDLKLIKLLHLLPIVIQKVFYVCLFLKCSQLEIIQDSEPLVEFSLVPLLLVKKSESKVVNMKLEKNMIVIPKLSKELFL